MGAPISEAEVDNSSRAAAQLASAWEQYRSVCFFRPSPQLIWVWSAAHEFDFVAAGLHLVSLPGVRIELGTHALTLVLPHQPDPELHEWHVIPLTRMKLATLHLLQPCAAEDLQSRVEALHADQASAQSTLDQAVKTANLCRLLPGSSNGTIN